MYLVQYKSLKHITISDFTSLEWTFRDAAFADVL